MVQKFNAYAIRVGGNKERLWNNYSFPNNRKEQVAWVKEDKLIWDYLYRVLPDISRLRIEHNQNSIFLEVFIPEIDLILGGDQEKIKEIVSEIKSRLNHEKIKLSLRLREIKNVYADAQTIANMIASQIKQQMPVMLILRNMIKKILPERKKGVEGGEIIISGIIDKSGISQTKKRSWGRFPFSSIDSNIELGRQEAIISRGKVGIKVALYKGKFWRKKHQSAATQTF